MIAMTEAALSILYRATYSSWPGLSGHPRGAGAVHIMV
jgi:hypothetical protein